MAGTDRYFFKPRATDEFLAEVLCHRRGPTETDFDLYAAAGLLFVVGNHTHRRAGVLTNSHTRYTVAEFLALDPRYRRRMAAALRAQPSQPDGERPARVD
jgi:DNA-binding response OmpR family regulator